MDNNDKHEITVPAPIPNIILGDIVYYYGYERTHSPMVALVVNVNDDGETVNLAVFKRLGGVFTVLNVGLTPSGKMGHYYCLRM